MFFVMFRIGKYCIFIHQIYNCTHVPYNKAIYRYKIISIFSIPQEKVIFLGEKIEDFSRLKIED